MDNRLSTIVMGIPNISTRRLLLSKPYNQPHYPLSTSKIDGIERKDSFVVLIKNYVSLGPKLIETVKHKLSYGAKILPLGREEKIFRKQFTTRDGEELLHATQCYIYTTAGAIAGILFNSTERVGFCSNRSLKMNTTIGEVLKFQYKVSIPLGKIKGVGESMNLKKPSNKSLSSEVVGRLLYLAIYSSVLFSFDVFTFQSYKQVPDLSLLITVSYRVLIPTGIRAQSLSSEVVGRLLYLAIYSSVLFSFDVFTFQSYKQVPDLSLLITVSYRVLIPTVRLGPKLMEIVKHKLNYGAKVLPLGREGRIFSKTFSTRDCEKLLRASRYSIYTTAGAIKGILFISNERVGFCSDRSLKTYSAAGEVLKFQYKVSIPLGKIKGVEESMNIKMPSNKYVELVSVDNFSFWFLGFPNYKKTLRSLSQTINQSQLLSQLI
ncbi:hypothetical protein L1987_17008 [Smallanthus sonchifolius]|uniref:Uncharacterized protein n=1 Tax=Smallanthus sonchifolius TaxID=185202 RepID=A0ACB9IWS2_9ASTR|nr:hypothetical protein L1987_17008 [Smallanthus sonchifolius]